MGSQTMEGARRQHPLFEKYTVDELHRRCHYKLTYLVAIHAGQSPASRRFRSNVSDILRKSQDELFLADLP